MDTRLTAERIAAGHGLGRTSDNPFITDVRARFVTSAADASHFGGLHTEQGSSPFIHRLGQRAGNLRLREELASVGVVLRPA